MGLYLKYHEKFLAQGCRNPEYFNMTGLCCAMGYDAQLLNLFEPFNKKEWPDKHSWWGSGDINEPLIGEYTPLRQNIVILLAAMNNEL